MNFQALRKRYAGLIMGEVFSALTQEVRQSEEGDDFQAEVEHGVLHNMDESYMPALHPRASNKAEEPANKAYSTPAEGLPESQAVTPRPCHLRYGRYRM
jgi:hypothetical protein